MTPGVPLRSLTEGPATPCKPSPFEPWNTVLCVVPLPQCLLWSTVVHSVRRAVCVSAICRTGSPPPSFLGPLLHPFPSLLGGLITLRHTLPLAPLLPVFGCPQLALLSVFLPPSLTRYLLRHAAGPLVNRQRRPHLAETHTHKVTPASPCSSLSVSPLLNLVAVCICLSTACPCLLAVHSPCVGTPLDIPHTLRPFPRRTHANRQRSTFSAKLWTQKHRCSPIWPSTNSTKPTPVAY